MEKNAKAQIQHLCQAHDALGLALWESSEKIRCGKMDGEKLRKSEQEIITLKCKLGTALSF